MVESHREGSFGARSGRMGKSLTRKGVPKSTEGANSSTGGNALGLVREECISKRN